MYYILLLNCADESSIVQMYTLQARFAYYTRKYYEHCTNMNQEKVLSVAWLQQEYTVKKEGEDTLLALLYSCVRILCKLQHHNDVHNLGVKPLHNTSIFICLFSQFSLHTANFEHPQFMNVARKVVRFTKGYNTGL